MIERLIEFSLRNRFLIVLAYVLLAVWGYWALLSTPIDAIPDLSENQVIVFADWPGRSPQEVEDQITYPLTVNLQGLPLSLIHISEPTRQAEISYAVFCLKKKKKK